MKTEIGGFPLAYQNLIGNTVVHNAVSNQDPKLLKLVIVHKFNERLLDNPKSISDVTENLQPSLSKVLLLKNQKGLTPFQVAIESGGLPMFKMLLDIYLHLD